jgi:hypothetical protein
MTNPISAIRVVKMNFTALGLRLFFIGEKYKQWARKTILPGTGRFGFALWHLNADP